MTVTVLVLNDPLTSCSVSQPITWTSLALAGVVGSGAVYYYYAEKDRLQTQSAWRS